MPELPEVETVRRELETYIVGQTIHDILVKTPSIVSGDIDLLRGKTVIAAQRFSKLLVLDTSDNFSVAIHLKMTGRLVFDDRNHPEYRSEWEYDYVSNRHTHLIISFSSGAQLYFNDYRRFGTIEIVETTNLTRMSYIKNLGKEFFVDLTVEEFSKVLAKTSRAIKVVLLDQTKVAGVGNIYANEALWMAKIHPETPAKYISPSQGHALHKAIEDTMRVALSRGGASSDNFRDLFSRKGNAQNYFFVYGRAGDPCPRCSTPIEKYFLGGRGTFLCPICQKQT